MKNNFYKMNKQIYLRIFFLFILFIFLLVRCQKEVTNIKLPETNPKLVAGCFISPQDTLIVVTLTRSNPIFGSGHNSSNNSFVTDASVIISNGINAVAVPYNNTNWQYELQASAFPVLSGKTYYLNISTPKGENVSARCAVPPSNLSSMTIDFIDTTSSEQKINVKWTDIPNQINYYRVFAQTVMQDSFMNDTTYFEMYSDNSLQNDNEKDGQEMSSKLNAYSSYGGTNNIIGYDFYLLNIDEEYYKYYRSLENFSYGDPFSEPSPLYTNINGGLGVFAAYQKIHVRKN